jgi:hypothetical protein
LYIHITTVVYEQKVNIVTIEYDRVNWTLQSKDEVHPPLGLRKPRLVVMVSSFVRKMS